jgi:hypothetical protein
MQREGRDITNVYLVCIMFNPTQVVIEAFVRELQATYVHTYSVLEPLYPDVIR